MTAQADAASEELPAYALPVAEAAPLLADWPHRLTRDWAWGGSSGAGVRVCIVDSGIDGAHPLVGGVQRAVVPRPQPDGTLAIEEDGEGDASGHGTACAGIVRALAPDCELASVRVLGRDTGGTGRDLLAGLRWAIENRYDVINLSLSTTRREFVDALHDLADLAYFRRSIVVAAAHNLPVDSWPWRFASVVSVAGHTSADPLEYHYNGDPPVEFFARGVDVEVAWSDGATIRATGNSFAAPHLAGVCALILGRHPELTPFGLKSALYLTATNVTAPR
jgi:subtilisin family serine protease